MIGTIDPKKLSLGTTLVQFLAFSSFILVGPFLFADVLDFKCLQEIVVNHRIDWLVHFRYFFSRSQWFTFEDWLLQELAPLSEKLTFLDWDYSYTKRNTELLKFWQVMWVVLICMSCVSWVVCVQLRKLRELCSAAWFVVSCRIEWVAWVACFALIVVTGVTKWT